MIKFRCPHCNQKLGVPDEYANHRIRCSKCNEPSRVPAAAPMPIDRASQSQTQAAVKNEATATVTSQPDRPVAQPENIQLQKNISSTVASSQEIDLDELEMAEETSNRQAVRQARQMQQRKQQVRASVRKPKRTPKEKTESGSRFQLAGMMDFVPDILRLPLGLAAAAASIIFMTIVWIVASRSTLNALGFMALFVPMAGAAGLKVFTVERTFLLAMLGTVIGGFGICVGKYAVAKYVVIPYAHEQVNKEVLVDLTSLLADEQYQLPQGQSAKFISQDGDFMECVALISLVDDGLADPEAARKWAFYTLLASNKTNIYAHLATILGSGPDAPPRPEATDEDEAMLDLASTRMMEWYEQELELRKARQYFPALNCIAGQANLYRLLEKPDTAFKFAILETLGLFDALWILVGMGLAYITLAMD